MRNATISAFALAAALTAAVPASADPVPAVQSSSNMHIIGDRPSGGGDIIPCADPVPLE